MSDSEQTTALVRLAVSRERMRLALGGAVAAQGEARPFTAHGTSPDAASPSPSPSQRSPAPPRVPAGGWLDRLLASPLSQVLVETVSSWWLRHPLRPVVALTTTAMNVAIKPVAQRHPVGLVFGALLAGGLLAWIGPSRPLRWLVRPAFFAGLPQQLLSNALTEMPLQAWLATWADMAQAPKQSEAPDAHR